MDCFINNQRQCLAMLTDFLKNQWRLMSFTGSDTGREQLHFTEELKTVFSSVFPYSSLTFNLF